MIQINKDSVVMIFRMQSFEDLTSYQTALINFITSYASHKKGDTGFENYSEDKQYLGEILKAFMISVDQLIVFNQEYERNPLLMEEIEKVNSELHREELEKHPTYYR